MDQVFDLIYYGNGGFTFSDLYSMPVNLRSYYYAKLVAVVEAKAKAEAEHSKKMQKGKRF